MKINSMRRVLLECWTYVILVLATSATEMLPKFIEEPESAVISHHASVTLPCKVVPSSAVVRWKFNGEFIEPGKTRGFSLNGTNLYIEDFKPKPKGIYQCIAKTTFGSVTSRPAKLSKTVLKKFQSREDLHLNVTEGHNVRLPCQPPKSNPKADIYFEVNGTKILGSSDHYRISSKGLFINNVSKSDHGQYRCIATNPVTNQTRRANHVIHLHVQNTSTAITQEAVILSTSKEVEAREGDTIVLECFASGIPQPNITWERYGGEIPNQRFSVVHGNLIIQNVTEADDGTYLCKANNGIGGEKVDYMILKFREPPVVTAETTHVTVNPGESVRLSCEVGGKPDPETIWYHNAIPVTDVRVETKGTTYSISDIQLRDAGYYQCMSSNIYGVSYATIKVEVKEQTVAPPLEGGQDGTTEVGNTANGNNDITDTTSQKTKNTSAGRRRKDRKRNKKRRRKNRRKNKGRKKHRRPPSDESASKVKLVPPTAPDVEQLSDTSVKLNWSVPENDGLPITFFRVQYKMIKPKKGNWKTNDVEIPFDRRVYEVSGLKQEATYKFRIAAVYSNNDNKNSPNSEKYTLHLEPFPDPKAPENKPTIVEVKPVEYEENADKKYALNIKWTYQPKKTSPIEGFFLFYKPFDSADDYKRLPLMEAGLRSHLLKDLQPDTEYSVKLQSFNSVGVSRDSTPVVKRTGGPSGPFKFPPINKPIGPEISLKPEPQEPRTTAKSVSSEIDGATKTDSQSSSEMLYMILGIVLGVMMLLLIVFMFMCWWKQRQQRRMMDAMNDAVRTKFIDPSQRIYADSLRKKYTNSGFGVNGTVPNGHVPNSYTKMNINVNPMSEMDMHSLSNGHSGHNQYQVSTFVPNGTVPSLSQESDNNCNKINRSLNSSQQCGVNHSVHSVQSPDSLGSGEAPACPPSPSTQGSSCVPTSFDALNSDSQEGYSNRSCDHLSGSHDYLSQGVDYGTRHSNDSSLPSDNGGNHMGKHKKRRKRVPYREHATRDQATNTDLSSNEGTIEYSSSNKVPNASQISGHNSPVRTYSSDTNHSVTDHSHLSQGV